MNRLIEGNLQITIPAKAEGRKFDDETAHVLTHCMKAVDFIIELKDRYLFVEVKDPEDPRSQPKEREKFVQISTWNEKLREYPVKRILP